MSKAQHTFGELVTRHAASIIRNYERSIAPDSLIAALRAEGSNATADAAEKHNAEIRAAIAKAKGE